MQSRNVLSALAQGLAIAAILLGCWWAVKAIFGPADYLLPSPWSVIRAILQPEQRLLEHTGITLFESLAGFVLGNALAFIAAIQFQLSPSSRKLLMPVAIALKTTPIVAIAPLLIIWFGPGIYTKIIASALVCFFPMLVGLYQAMTQTPQAMVEYYESLGTSEFEQVTRLRLLYAVPEFFAALRVSSTLAVVGAVVGEMVSATSGLGYVIIVSAYSFQTQVTFAAIALIALCGFMIYFSVELLSFIVREKTWRNDRI